MIICTSARMAGFSVPPIYCSCRIRTLFSENDSGGHRFGRGLFSHVSGLFQRKKFRKTDAFASKIIQPIDLDGFALVI
jgi:hypothetical protein